MPNDYNHSIPDSHKKIGNLIRSVEREIEYRRRIYPLRVTKGTMTEGQYRYELNCMKEIRVILHVLERTGYMASPEAKITREILERTKPELANR